MKGRKRKTTLILAGIGIVLLVAAVVLFLGDKERRITDFVRSNETELEKIALDCLQGKETADEYKGVEVWGVLPGEHQIVEFFSDGAGLAPSSIYYGFYYSEDDVPVAFQNSHNSLTAVSDSEWTWSDGTDNGGLTKKITAHWYYYKAWF